MEQYYGVVYSDEYLEHFGIKGQKWGIRKYQNPDGTLTEEGKKRYGSSASSIQKGLNKLDQSKAEYARDADRYAKNPNYGSGYSKKKIEQTNKAVNQLLDMAKKQKMSVTQIKANRITDRGEAWVANFLGGPLATAATMAVSNFKLHPYKGTYYKVRY
jgi:hypothetical protein